MQPCDAASEEPGRLTFRRNALRQGAELGCGCVAAIGFAGAGLALAAETPLALLIFGFFAVFAALSTISQAQRGSDTRLVEVEPAGIWLPEMEFLRWPDVAEVRLESIRGIANSDVAATRRYRRLGVVPRDPTLRPTSATRVAWRFVDVYVRLMRRMAPALRLGGQDLAPFGVSEMELSPASFDRLLAAVGRYVEVVDADRRRAVEHAPRWDATARAASPDLAVLDAALGAAASPTTAMPATIARPPAAPAPSASFVAAGSVRGLGTGILQALAPLLAFVSIWFVLPSEWYGRLGPVVWFGLAMLLVAMAPGSIRVIRQLRSRANPEVVLRVGPDGVWLPDMGLVGWPDVAAVRTERAGFTRTPEGAALERWRLVVVPTAGAGDRSGVAFGVSSDQLTERFDDVLDLVRVYHPVDEGG